MTGQSRVQAPSSFLSQVVHLLSIACTNPECIQASLQRYPSLITCYSVCTLGKVHTEIDSNLQKTTQLTSLLQYRQVRSCMLLTQGASIRKLKLYGLNTYLGFLRECTVDCQMQFLPATKLQVSQIIWDADTFSLDILKRKPRKQSLV